MISVFKKYITLFLILVFMTNYVVASTAFSTQGINLEIQKNNSRILKKMIDKFTRKYERLSDKKKLRYLNKVNEFLTSLKTDVEDSKDNYLVESNLETRVLLESDKSLKSDLFDDNDMSELQQIVPEQENFHLDKKTFLEKINIMLKSVKIEKDKVLSKTKSSNNNSHKIMYTDACEFWATNAVFGFIGVFVALAILSVNPALAVVSYVLISHAGLSVILALTLC